MIRQGTIAGGSRRGLTQVRLISVVAVLIFVFAWQGALAQTCQTPLFIQEGQVEANVMVLFDNSGSMNEAMYHRDFDSNISYAGGYGATNMYYINSSRDYVINGRTAYLTKAPGGYSGRYIGNYLNWIFWVATEEQRNAIPRVIPCRSVGTTATGYRPPLGQCSR